MTVQGVEGDIHEHQCASAATISGEARKDGTRLAMEGSEGTDPKVTIKKKWNTKHARPSNVTTLGESHSGKSNGASLQ